MMSVLRFAYLAGRQCGPLCALDMMRYDWWRFRHYGWASRVSWVLPRKVVYFAVIRAWAGATLNDTDPLAITTDEVVRRWDNGEGR